MSQRKITVTAALPYANGPIHLGHLAGAYLPADFYVRWRRLRGDDVIFVCGSDEHGVPITIRARKEGITPQELVDRNHALIRDTFDRFGISFDHYGRTSDPLHHETASEMFSDLMQKGAFTEEVTEQFYDEEAGQFLADRYIIGTCPVCANPNAYGDQCEKCGSTLSPQELKDPRSALSGNPPVMRPTKNWYLPLDRLQNEFLNQYINSRENWKSNVLGQCRSWLNEGLRPRAMTRDLDWGVKVPVAGEDGKVLYVWFEAPIGYISITRQLKPANWQEYWTGDAELIHFIGKDNIVFHCIIFPAMLHLYDHGFVVPKQVPANEFLNLEGDKISTSRNWAVWLHEYMDELPGREDELRYVLGSILPETKDSEFTWKDWQTRINSELVGILGNFVNRVLVLSGKFTDNRVPDMPGFAPESGSPVAEIWKETDQAVLAAWSEMNEHIEAFRFRDALAAMMQIARLGNRFLAATEPWKMKDDYRTRAWVLDRGLQICACLQLAAEVFLPATASRLSDQLNYKPDAATRKQYWKNGLEWPLLPAGHELGEAGLLFRQVEDEVVEQQVKKLQSMISTHTAETPEETAAAFPPALKDTIQYDDFAKLDIRVVKVLTAEAVPKADKLLKLTLDTGMGERTVLSGIAQHFKPEEVAGKTVLWLGNLAPRKMRGIESEGMILMAEDAQGRLHFVQPAGDAEPGSTVS
jgi:methionyl-tRNA synthetase